MEKEKAVHDEQLKKHKLIFTKEDTKALIDKIFLNRTSNFCDSHS